MTEQEIVDAFAAVPGRGTADQAFRALENAQVQLSVMADTKASIMITVCSIVLTIAFTQANDPILRLPMFALTSFTLIALVLAVLAVLPSRFRPLRKNGVIDTNSPEFSLFFFGHFSQMTKAEYELEIAERLQDDGRLYRTIAGNVYGHGKLLAKHKYAMLRRSYLAFLFGFVSSAAMLLVRVALDTAAS